MLTILLGTGVGVAVVLYTVKPRQTAASQSLASGVSSIETISLPSQPTLDSKSYSAPAQPATATQSSVVEAPVEVHAISSVSTAAPEVVVAGPSEPVASVDAPAVSAPAPEVTAAPRASTAVRSQRAPRRSSASPRTHARPRATAGSKTAAIKKR